MDLPNEALASIFSFLNPIESVSCRSVCKRWSKSAGQGLVLLTVRRPPKERFYLVKHIIGYITFNGRIQTGDTNGNDKTAIHTEPQRTRGHLLKPSASITQDVHNDNNLSDVSITFATDRLKDTERGHLIEECRNVNSCTDALEAGYVLSMRSGGNNRRHLCAIQVEGTHRFVTLDLSTTSSKAVYCYRTDIGDDIEFDQMMKPKKQNTLRSILGELDLSGLHHLRELSVRGCSKLIKLKLPQSLISLDAGGCTELCRINFPNGADCLKSLDLNGCRAVDQPSGLLGLYTSQAMKSVIHLNLDISNVNQNCLDGMFCNALRSTVSLETFSCRYAATDNSIKALAGSVSAASNLRLVDIAFSKEVTDESVELLARSATKLERLNMRGCKKVTAGCYNHIPIYLERRRQNRE